MTRNWDDALMRLCERAPIPPSCRPILSLGSCPRGCWWSRAGTASMVAPVDDALSLSYSSLGGEGGSEEDEVEGRRHAPPVEPELTPEQVRAAARPCTQPTLDRPLRRDGAGDMRGWGISGGPKGCTHMHGLVLSPTHVQIWALRQGSQEWFQVFKYRA